MNLLLLSMVVGAWSQTAPAGPARWEPTIQKFEAEDRQSPPAPGGVLFVGSSSIRLWKLDESFPGKNYLNRGFGGSQIGDVNHFIDRIVIPYKPAKIVFYAGDNDVGSGKSAEKVLADFQHFVERVHAKLPEAQILFIAIKPSVRRWQLWPTMNDANQRIQGFAASTEYVKYVDIAKPMLGEDGKPRPELFVKDGLHLSEKGYEVWTAALREFGL